MYDILDVPVNFSARLYIYIEFNSNLKNWILVKNNYDAGYFFKLTLQYWVWFIIEVLYGI